MSNRVAVAVMVALLLPAGGTGAQQAEPRLTLRSSGGVTAYKDWPGTTLSVDQDAYVTVFAVTRGRRNFPIAVLSPASPGTSGRLKAGRKYGVRSLSSTQLLHLVDYGEAPLVVGFASKTKPNLDPFADLSGWGPDLLVTDSSATDAPSLIRSLAQAMYPTGTLYDAVVQGAASPIPISYRATMWQFEDQCGGSTSTIQANLQRAEFFSPFNNGFPVSDVMNYLMRIGAQQQSIIPGQPFLASGGQVASIERTREFVGLLGCEGGYRVAWWPRAIIPQETGNVLIRQPKPDTAAMGHDRARGGPIEEIGPSQPIEGSRRRAREILETEESSWRRGETESERRFPNVRDVRRERMEELSTSTNSILQELLRGQRERVVDGSPAQTGDVLRAGTPIGASSGTSQIQSSNDQTRAVDRQPSSPWTSNAPESRRRERVVDAMTPVVVPQPVVQPPPTPTPAPTPPTPPQVPPSGKPFI